MVYTANVRKALFSYIFLLFNIIYISHLHITAHPSPLSYSTGVVQATIVTTESLYNTYTHLMYRLHNTQHNRHLDAHYILVYCCCCCCSVRGVYTAAIGATNPHTPPPPPPPIIIRAGDRTLHTHMQVYTHIDTHRAYPMNITNTKLLLLLMCSKKKLTKAFLKK